MAPLKFRVVAPSAWEARISSTAELARLPWIRMTPHSAHEELLNEILSRAGIAPVASVLADHELMIRELVTAGVGIGLLREDLALAAQSGGELVFVGDYGANTNLALIYPEERENDPAIRTVCEALRTLWR
ncbi:substrate-binding domain-containing protein [Cupriavidus basilensis]